MKIKYADHHKWVKILSGEDNLGCFGDSSKEKLKSTLNRVKEANISSIIRPVTEEFLAWFLPLYTDNIVKKANPKIFPVREKVNKGDKEYLALELYEDGVPIGGTIFSHNGDTVSTAYRSYRSNWQIVQLRANPSLYAEYLLEQYTRSKGCQRILHGRDRNPYGVNSGIGLALFKLGIGCRPYLSNSCALLEFDIDNCSTDVLIFEYPDREKEPINKGYLITSRATLDKWLPVTKYPHLIEVEVIYRD